MKFDYDEVTRTLTIVGSAGREIRLTNVSPERAARFASGYSAEATRMKDRGQHGDPLTFASPGATGEL